MFGLASFFADNTDNATAAGATGVVLCLTGFSNNNNTNITNRTTATSKPGEFKESTLNVSFSSLKSKLAHSRLATGPRVRPTGLDTLSSVIHLVRFCLLVISVVYAYVNDVLAQPIPHIARAITNTVKPLIWTRFAIKWIY